MNMRLFGSIVAVAALVDCDGSTSVTAKPDEFEWQATVTGNKGWKPLSSEAAFRWTKGTPTITAAIAMAGDEPERSLPGAFITTPAPKAAGSWADGQYPRLRDRNIYQLTRD
jgi:hypothetical protein